MKLLFVLVALVALTLAGEFEDVIMAEGSGIRLFEVLIGSCALNHVDFSPNNSLIVKIFNASKSRGRKLSDDPPMKKC